jgi:CRP/FNR family transcriptional regulator
MARSATTLGSYTAELKKVFPAVVAEQTVSGVAPGARNAREPLGPEFLSPHQMDLIFRSRKRIGAKGSLYRAGEPFAALYLVRAGAFKTLIRAEDGREQITGFYTSGDILGTDGFGQEQYACEAIALEDSEVGSLSLVEFDQLAQETPRLRRSLYRCVGGHIARGQQMMLVLGSMCAEERLAAFLLDLARHYHARGYSMSEFFLRMSRHEIASYLGLKLETISRLFSRFQEAGLLQVQGRMVKLLDLPALARLSGKGT